MAALSRVYALVGVVVLTLGLVSLPAQAQSSTAVSLSWAELEAGCEGVDGAGVDLRQCRSQLARWRSEYQTPLQQPDLLVPALDQILAELPVEVEPDLSLWARLWRWLREKLGDNPSELPSWLRNWELPETFADWMLGLSVGACVLLALGIVGNELLQVYRSRAMAYRPGTAESRLARSMGPKLPTLAELPSYPLQEQPGLLLHIVLNRLQQRQLLPRQVGRTHQDVLQQAPQLGALADPLTDIARAAERSTYGNWQVARNDLEPLLAAGERLIAEPDER